MQLQIVNPGASDWLLTAEANWADPYPDGMAAAHGDPGGGRVDLWPDAWRAVRAMDVGRELWQASPPGAGFVLLTGGAVVGLLRARLRSWGLSAAIMAIALRVGFELLAPWLG
ncbi:MAG: hypothetical protein OXG33_06440 [Chloroflexi bacterium]|nr:hypothetical protein [Chloroflexota bacterium]